MAPSQTAPVEGVEEGAPKRQLRSLVGSDVQVPSWQVPIEQVVPLGLAGLEHVPVPAWQVPVSWH